MLFAPLGLVGAVKTLESNLQRKMSNLPKRQNITTVSRARSCLDSNLNILLKMFDSKASLPKVLGVKLYALYVYV